LNYFGFYCGGFINIQLIYWCRKMKKSADFAFS
jgi:hypothetical protein